MKIKKKWTELWQLNVITIISEKIESTILVKILPILFHSQSAEGPTSNHLNYHTITLLRWHILQLICFVTHEVLFNPIIGEQFFFKLLIYKKKIFHQHLRLSDICLHSFDYISRRCCFKKFDNFASLINKKKKIIIKC